MSYSKFKYVKVELIDFCLWIYLNNPTKGNSLSLDLIKELIDVLEQADIDKEVRCIVLSGEGKHFCSGGDVDLMIKQEGMFAGDSNQLRENYKKGIQKIPLCIQKMSTPIIGMINGAAIGAGLDLACMCDIRIAEKTSKFGETFVKLGLVPGIGGTFFLQRIVGFAKAMEMSLTAKVYDGEEAFKMGLVNILCNKNDLIIETKKIVEKIISNAPIAVQLTKRAIVHAHQNDLDSSLEMLSAFQGIAQRTEDHIVGAKAIKDKQQNIDFKHQ